jgi:transglutaminase-like putative cysteine protease
MSSQTAIRQALATLRHATSTRAMLPALLAACASRGGVRPLEFEATEAAVPGSVVQAPMADSTLYLERLRRQYALDSVLAGARSDFERIRMLSRWVRGRWEHNGDNVPHRPDPLSILAEASTGKQFRCVEYSEVLAAALSASGIPARVLHLKTADSETRESGAGHVVAEAWMRDQGKWVMVDGQFDVIPMSGDTPLNAVEFQQAIATHARGLKVASFSGTPTKRYVGWVTPYLFYFDVNPEYWVTGVAAHAAPLMLVPLGVSPPVVFQRRFPLGGFRITHSVEEFYASPVKKEH